MSNPKKFYKTIRISYKSFWEKGMNIMNCVPLKGSSHTKCFLNMSYRLGDSEKNLDLPLLMEGWQPSDVKFQTRSLQVCKDCTWHSLCGVVCFCVIQTDDSSLQQYTIICSALIFGIYQFYQVFCQIARFYSNFSDQCLLMIPAGFPTKRSLKGPWPPNFCGGNPGRWFCQKLRPWWVFVRVPAWVGLKKM